MQAHESRPSAKRRMAFAAAPTLLLAALFCASEAAVRVLLPPLDPLRVFLRSPQELDNLEDRRQVSVFEADPLLYWRLRPDLDRVIWDYTLFSTNSQGLRHPRPVGLKPRDGFRILTLGDSVTFGFRVPVVWADRPGSYDPSWQPYPRLLEDRLRRDYPGRRIDVVSLAVPGYTSYQGLHWLRRDIDWLEPDVVTICFGWNDTTRRQRPDNESMPSGVLAALGRSLVQRSQLLMRVVAWSSSRGAEPATDSQPTERVPLPAFLENIAAMIDLAEAHGASALVIAPIYRDAPSVSPEAARIQVYRDALGPGVVAQGATYVEVKELTGAGSPRSADYFGEAIHPNHQGHRLLAEALLASLERSGALHVLEE